MTNTKFDEFKKYEINNLIIIKGGDEEMEEDVNPAPIEEEKPWWKFW